MISESGPAPMDRSSRLDPMLASSRPRFGDLSVPCLDSPRCLTYRVLEIMYTVPPMAARLHCRLSIHRQWRKHFIGVLLVLNPAVLRSRRHGHFRNSYGSLEMGSLPKRPYPCARQLYYILNPGPRVHRTSIVGGYMSWACSALSQRFGQIQGTGP